MTNKYNVTRNMLLKVGSEGIDQDGGVECNIKLNKGECISM